MSSGQIWANATQTSRWYSQNTTITIYRRKLHRICESWGSSTDWVWWRYLHRTLCKYVKINTLPIPPLTQNCVIWEQDHKLALQKIKHHSKVELWSLAKPKEHSDGGKEYFYLTQSFIFYSRQKVLLISICRRSNSFHVFIPLQ